MLIIQAFPLKCTQLKEESTLAESIDLFGSLMLQRVRSYLLDHYPSVDLSELTENSSIRDIYSMISRDSESSENFFIPSEHIASSEKSEISGVIKDISKINVSQVVSVGIDIESIEFLPSDIMLPSGLPFRSNTFCPKEVAYASTKSSPRQTLLGIFCAKESVIKCCTDFIALTFRDIEILHDSNGKPLCRVHPSNVDFDFKISISHSSEYACAVAVMTSRISRCSL